jgi:hypothetical protein
MGGIEIHLERKDAFLDSLEQPIPLVNEKKEVSLNTTIKTEQQHSNTDP